MPPKTRGSTESTRKRKAEEDQAKQENPDLDAPKEEPEVDGDKPETIGEVKDDVKEEGMYYVISDWGTVG
jgi:hypothetical protein